MKRSHWQFRACIENEIYKSISPVGAVDNLNAVTCTDEWPEQTSEDSLSSTRLCRRPTDIAKGKFVTGSQKSPIESRFGHAYDASGELATYVVLHHHARCTIVRRHSSESRGQVTPLERAHQLAAL